VDYYSELAKKWVLGSSVVNADYGFTKLCGY